MRNPPAGADYRYFLHLISDSADGGIRDLSEFLPWKDFPIYYRGAHASAMADQVGIAFEPARRRPGIVDVEGMLWLDRARPALRLLEFRYTNLDPLSMSTEPTGAARSSVMSQVATSDQFPTRSLTCFATSRPAGCASTSS